MFELDIVDMQQLVVDKFQFWVFNCGLYVVVIVVVIDNNVFNFEYIYCILNYGKVVQVGVNDQVSNIMVNKEFVWFKIG